MPEVPVDLGVGKSYTITVQRGCLTGCAQELAAAQLARKYAVVTDTTVARIYATELLENLQTAGCTARLFPIPAGEKNKRLATVEALAERMAQAGYDRHDAIIALGGGVTGDISGFLAAMYMRGVPFVQIPTTLLAQVDSSVGGKTGVDIDAGKNLLGAFYQPRAVYIDPQTLASLPREELLSGLAEVMKYGLIYDADFFDLLVEKRRAILHLEPDIIADLIATCCRIKAAVVMADEREGGQRRILNFGHTLGHAIEAASNFTISHGFAVAMGMYAATRLSYRQGRITAQQVDQVFAILSAYGLPTEIPAALDRKTIRAFCKTDKKAVDGQLIFVLLDAIGKAVITDQVSEKDLASVLQ